MAEIGAFEVGNVALLCCPDERLDADLVRRRLALEGRAQPRDERALRALVVRGDEDRRRAVAADGERAELAHEARDDAARLPRRRPPGRLGVAVAVAERLAALLQEPGGRAASPVARARARRRGL